MAAAPAPSVVAFTAAPTELTSAGGSVQLSASVQNATTCTFKSTPTVNGLPVDRDCGSGTATANVTLPANTTSKAKTYTFRLTATGTGRNAQADPITVTVAAAPAPSVVAFTAAPTELTSAGGSVQLSASVQNATTCTFKSTPTVNGLPVDRDCGSGTATANVTLPANTTSKAKTYTFRLTATGTGRNAQADPITVTVQPRGAPIDTTPPGPVTALAATAGTNGISLSWTNPRDPDLAAIVVRRALGAAAPSTVTDGDPVGTITPPAAQLTDPVPSDGSTYSYSVFARDSSGNYSGTRVRHWRPHSTRHRQRPSHTWQQALRRRRCTCPGQIRPTPTSPASRSDARRG